MEHETGAQHMTPAGGLSAGQRVRIYGWEHEVARVQCELKWVRGKRYVHLHIVGGGRVVVEHDELVEVLT